MQDADKDLALNDHERQQVTSALEAILATDKFDAAPQMSAFLRYVVEQAADGLQGRIKAFTVAVDALGKPDTFDPQNDPVVRVLAGRLRAALAAYNNDHPDAPVIIKMSPGSYVPMFVYKHSTVQNSSAPGQTAHPSVANAVSADNDLQSLAKTAVNTMAAGSHDEWTHSLASHPDSDVATNQHGVSLQSTLPRTGFLSRLFSTAPLPALAGVVVAAVVGGALLKNAAQDNQEPVIEAALPLDTSNTLLSERAEPDQPSVFITAVDEGCRLENSLNALLSGVISEKEGISVYRILSKQNKIKFWPDDYILTVSAMSMPGETRINLQLIDAPTGQIVHSEAVSLNEDAPDQLTQQEMNDLIVAARLIVSDDGPMATHQIRD